MAAYMDTVTAYNIHRFDTFDISDTPLNEKYK